MSLKASTGLRSLLLDTSPFRTLFNLGFIKVYDGPVPASADDSLDAANHLLVTISNNATATGLTFEAAAVLGAISKKLTETWRGVAILNGTASFYRLVTPADSGALSTVLPRLQGSAGLVGSDLVMVTTTIVNATSYPIDDYAVTLPTL
jgi:hypothetical protein